MQVSAFQFDKSIDFILIFEAVTKVTFRFNHSKMQATWVIS